MAGTACSSRRTTLYGELARSPVQKAKFFNTLSMAVPSCHEMVILNIAQKESMSPSWVSSPTQARVVTDAGMVLPAAPPLALLVVAAQNPLTIRRRMAKTCSKT